MTVVTPAEEAALSGEHTLRLGEIKILDKVPYGPPISVQQVSTENLQHARSIFRSEIRAYSETASSIN